MQGTQPYACVGSVVAGRSVCWNPAHLAHPLMTCVEWHALLAPTNAHASMLDSHRWRAACQHSSGGAASGAQCGTHHPSLRVLDSAVAEQDAGRPRSPSPSDENWRDHIYTRARSRSPGSRSRSRSPLSPNTLRSLGVNLPGTKVRVRVRDLVVVWGRGPGVGGIHGVRADNPNLILQA